MKKIAFTLAEVLITLGIIGIVAAMTLPTLIQSNKNKERVISFTAIFDDFVHRIKSISRKNNPYERTEIP